MTISKAAFDLIVEQEVSSQTAYTARYTHPEWPGVSSGVTIGIGYDCGYATKDKLWADWKGRIPDGMISALERAVGVTGVPAKALATALYPQVVVPWEAAIAVFSDRDVPKWEATVRRALPNCDKLSADCMGALVSLAYNRGASFGLAGDRYTEMRNIKAHMAAGEFDKIPGEFEAMKRLWPTVAGLRSRRDKEAALFRKGLGAPAAPVPAPVVKPKANVDQKAAASVASGGTATVIAHQAGVPPGLAVGIGIVVAIIVAVIFILRKGK